MKTLRAYHIFAVFFIAIAVLAGCSDNKYTGSNRTPMTELGPNITVTGEKARENSMIRDVLGGAIATAIDPVEINYDGVEKKFISVSVAFSSETSEINETFVFPDENGAETLTIIATGEVEEMTTRETESSILKFTALSILFQFNEFAFTNACGVPATLTGEFKCTASGTYTREDEHYKGGVSCMTGTERADTELRYKFNGDEHDIFAAVNANVDGNVFDLQSYSFYGSFYIDGKRVPVSKLMDAQLVCEE
jgi:hypothetical protein